MPDGLVNVLTQYPIVVVIGFVAWYAYKQVRQNNAEHLAEIRAANERLIATLREVNSDLRDGLTAEVKKVGQKVDALARKLG